jgi:hypothetical protein
MRWLVLHLKAQKLEWVADVMLKRREKPCDRVDEEPTDDREAVEDIADDGTDIRL